MTFDEACGIKSPDDYGWAEKYARYVQHVGRGNIREYLPVKGAALARAWLADGNLNNVPLKRWEDAAGFQGYKNGQQTPPVGRGPFIDLLASKGVTRFSLSECVSLLKKCAEMEVRDFLAEMLAGVQSPGSGGLEIWAVFEHCSARTDKANRYNIFDFDCAAAFWSEDAAIRYEQENPGRRVRKLVRVPGTPARRDGGDHNDDKEGGGTDA